MRAELPAQCCRLCGIANGSRSLGAIDQPWLESDNYMAFVSLGALVEGWTLIAPKNHSLNLAASYGGTEFEGFVREVMSTVQETYGKAVVFEHGAQVETSKTSCGTSHAHLHVVPLNFSLATPAIDFDESLVWQRCSATDISTFAGSSEYLFVSDDYLGTPNAYACLLDEGQSQFFRRVIADKLGRIEEFDYRTHPQIGTATASAFKLQAASSRRVLAAA